MDGLFALAMATEIARAEVRLQQVADPYYTQAFEEIGQFRTVKYGVKTLGKVRGSTEEFREVVAEVLEDARGWSRAGVRFVESDEDIDLWLILAEPVKIGAMPGCSARLSCTVKPRVYINDDRWMGASESYIERGVSVADYRKMVINHEVGHFLGHDHAPICKNERGKGPIMIATAEDLGACAPSRWPLPYELWYK